MSNQRSFYFGAYLRVVTKPRMKSQGMWVCQEHNSLDYFPNRFCQECGNALERLPAVETYPDWYDIEQELPETYHEQMRELTHHKENVSVILLCGNTIDDGETWLYLGANKYDEIEPKTKPLPDELEKENMVKALISNHRDAIAEIQKNESVDLILYSCGFVLTEDI